MSIQDQFNAQSNLVMRLMMRAIEDGDLTEACDLINAKALNTEDLIVAAWQAGVAEQAAIGQALSSELNSDQSF